MLSVPFFPNNTQHREYGRKFSIKLKSSRLSSYKKQLLIVGRQKEELKFKTILEIPS